MAILIPGHSRCALCGGTDLERPSTATSGVAFPPGHELHAYCDAPLHLACLEAWPHRERFSRGYLDAARAAVIGGYGLLLAEAPGWLLRCGPANAGGTPAFAELLLADWPVRLYARWADWPGLLAGGFARGLEGAALRAAEEAVQGVRPIAGGLEALTGLRQAALRRTGDAPPGG